MEVKPKPKTSCLCALFLLPEARVL